MHERFSIPSRLPERVVDLTQPHEKEMTSSPEAAYHDILPLSRRLVKGDGQKILAIQSHDGQIQLCEDLSQWLRQGWVEPRLRLRYGRISRVKDGPKKSVPGPLTSKEMSSALLSALNRLSSANHYIFISAVTSIGADGLTRHTGSIKICSINAGQEQALFDELEAHLKAGPAH